MHRLVIVALLLGGWAGMDAVAVAFLRDGWTAGRAEEILASRKGETQPFFLAVGFSKPHLPFVAPRRYWDLHDPARLPVAEPAPPPRGAPSFAPQFGGELRAYDGIPASGPIPSATARELVHGYYAAVSFMDAQVGRVLDALQRDGFADDTIVILWGDHGWHLGDHGMWCKHTNYEEATRSALVLAAPGRAAAGRTTDALVELVDIYPTLADLCGLPQSDGLEGHSFSRLLDDPTRAWKPAAGAEMPPVPVERHPTAVMPPSLVFLGYAVRKRHRWRLVDELLRLVLGGLGVRALGIDLLPR